MTTPLPLINNPDWKEITRIVWKAIQIDNNLQLVNTPHLPPGVAEICDICFSVAGKLCTTVLMYAAFFILLVCFDMNS